LKPADSVTVSGPHRLVLGLALTPCAAVVTATALDKVRISAELGAALAFAGAALMPIVGLALAATCVASTALTLAIALFAGASSIALADSHTSPLLALLGVDTSLVALAWALGASIGRRVQHASHLLPACVVAACADLVSVLSPEGPSHAIATSARALSVFATWFPVPGSGTHALAPALGVGDLLFMALLLGVARAQRLPYFRTIFLCLLGTSLAGLCAARTGGAVPALLPIATSVILGLPAARQLRAVDRKAALWSMLIAGALAIATILRNFLVRS
jgi:hypothetical protein